MGSAVSVLDLGDPWSSGENEALSCGGLALKRVRGVFLQLKPGCV